uniref:Polymerase beta nucleotidyltransferase domain-containing protein n=1 Tax=Gracilinema caldarium TaxID=215591 RepID=A0A7C3IDW0_9SPIR
MNQYLSFTSFLSQLKKYRTLHKEILCILLVRSFARGTQREDSDIDMVLLTEQKETMLSKLSWVHQFGHLISSQIEDYGRITSSLYWQITNTASILAV